MLEPAYLSADYTHLMSNKTKLEHAEVLWSLSDILSSDSHVIVG